MGILAVGAIRAGGPRERRAIAVGEVCTPADSAEAGSAVADLVVEASEAVEDSVARVSGGNAIGSQDRKVMWYSTQSRMRLALPVWKLGTLLAAMLMLASCHKSENAAATSQRTFASPAEAGSALFEAVKSGDQNSLLAIFGPDGKDEIFSGDAVRDRDNQQDFIAGYQQMNRWVKIKPSGQILQIGADNYPFPIPLGQNQAGQWYFDTAAGRDEILARRIGQGELTAILACSAIADAQKQYFNQIHDGDKVKQYAQKFVSDAGKQNGLYWPVSEGQPMSPLGPLGEFAKALGYTNPGDKPQPFNGYYFQILTKQGDQAQGGAKNYIVDGKMTRGFAVVAYPAEYRNSGIMTFVIGPDGVVYQRDLGEKTKDTAMSMAEYNPDDGWSRVGG
jgi:hypothetical protein